MTFPFQIVIKHAVADTENSYCLTNVKVSGNSSFIVVFTRKMTKLVLLVLLFAVVVQLSTAQWGMGMYRPWGMGGMGMYRPWGMGYGGMGGYGMGMYRPWGMGMYG
ncbi:unnamed protein product [Bursaphelenchus okinawaensis]|uniref:Uncharacterized protein n=1 Tax=Bursaphelenchus okinawaensis TaxID=465554 RepID=A0A811L123_9BILA|nr:unnamed protein product [Bursaphelenchus okinawaensis]CAG9115089.1 unnamed protein product [Bursaphelenchus okinawaensis]